MPRNWVSLILHVSVCESEWTDGGRSGHYPIWLGLEKTSTEALTENWEGFPLLLRYQNSRLAAFALQDLHHASGKLRLFASI
jgi:hypothetical protein